MKKKIFIILPALDNNSPVKGAIVLANYLSDLYEVCLIGLKKSNSKNIEINSKISLIDLSINNRNIFLRFLSLRKIIMKNKNENIQSIVISYCITADIFNFFLRSIYKIYSISSMRANFYKDYFYLYGLKGYLLAVVHFLLIKRLDLVIVMTKSMSDLVKPYRIKNIIIPNFINEYHINNLNLQQSKTSSSIYKLCFIGGLTKRKKIFLLIKTFEKLLKENLQVELNIIGSGSERSRCTDYINKKKLDKFIIMHNEIESPFNILSQSDLFILPSMSEGTSRAAMEALYIGIPIVIRDIDGNSELINNDNGKLFSSDEDLKKTIISAIDMLNKRNNQKIRKNLLPNKFSYDSVTSEYQKLISQI